MSDLSEGAWRIIDEECWDGPLQMALDEIAARTAAEGGRRTIRIYRWRPSTLSLGYAQEPETIDWDFCQREGITVTRRPTGGGAIYHDFHGDVSYSITVPADDVPGDLMECYKLLCDPILTAFERMGVDVAFADGTRPAIYQPACYLRAVHPAHDIVASDGRKISGNAQYRQRDVVIQHGSLTFSTTPERHCACFTGVESADQIAGPGDGTDPQAFTNRVSGIDEYVDIERDDVVDTLSSTLTRWAGADAGSWTDGELSDARDLAARKYATDDWVRDAN